MISLMNNITNGTFCQEMPHTRSSNLLIKLEGQRYRPNYCICFACYLSNFFFMHVTHCFHNYFLLTGCCFNSLIINICQLFNPDLFHFTVNYICLSTYFLFNNSNKHTSYLLKTEILFPDTLSTSPSFTKSWKIDPKIPSISYFTYTTLCRNFIEQIFFPKRVFLESCVYWK
jgi:hypothetical protein